ncbi:MAG: ORF6N domain-containing protein [Elusimicrobia bacterium]|nr:ORF6N domain-containing protein [Elusimicrobiota bacterium]
MAFATPALPLERRIWIIRGRRVMLDADLAEVYGVPTKRLNEQVRRNPGRFPTGFMFRLTRAEARVISRLRSQSATLRWGQNIKYLPLAFTEHGAVMLASVLNSSVAVGAIIEVVRAFVRLREMIAKRAGLGRRLTALERKVSGNSQDITRIFNVLQGLIEPSAPVPKRIGFSP